MPAEVSVEQGRIDAFVETDTHIYILEFKKNRKASVALEQIKEKKYAEHFALSNLKGLLRRKQIKLIGVAFNLRNRGISDSIIVPFNPHADS